MINVVDQSALWNPLLTSEIFTRLGETAKNSYSDNYLYIYHRNHKVGSK